MKIGIATVVVIGTALVGCTDEPAARETLRKAGFRDVRITGYDAWACGRDDYTHTGFVAKNSNGEEVAGTVCCGTWKRCTVRW